VLIVDDDPATVSFMQLAFESAGDEVATASSVDQALDQLTNRVPDVVLSDLALGRDGDAPGDGFRLVRVLRNRPESAHIGVLAVSGADFPEVLRATADQGFDGFVSKPIDVASLLERVHRLAEVAIARRAPDVGIDRPDDLGDVEGLDEDAIRIGHPDRDTVGPGGQDDHGEMRPPDPNLGQ